MSRTDPSSLKKVREREGITRGRARGRAGGKEGGRESGARQAQDHLEEFAGHGAPGLHALDVG